MKNVFFSKLLSAVTASAMAFSFIIGAPFDFGVTVKANAEDYNPSAFAYATAEQLGNNTTFAPSSINGIGGNTAEIYFGEKDGVPVSCMFSEATATFRGNQLSEYQSYPKNTTTKLYYAFFPKVCL